MSPRQEYSEDMFSDTRMSFGEHLAELQMYMWKAVYGFVLALLLSFFIGKPVLLLIAAPVEDELRAFYDARFERFKKEAKEAPPEYGMNAPKEFQVEIGDGDGKWLKRVMRIRPIDLVDTVYKPLQQVGRRPGLSTLSVQEAFMAYFKVCLYCGVVIGSPWIFFQLWLFVAAGLYPHEKRLVHVYLPFSLGLFLSGVAMCQFIVIPRAIKALLWFNEWIGLEPDIRFNEWLSFAILMPLVFGVAFQMPLVMMFLERLGIITTAMMKGQWRMAFFLIQVFAAVFSPSVDAVSMELLALPMFGLYWLGILLCRLNPPKPEFDLDTPEEEEDIEV